MKSRPELDQQIRDVLAKLELISHGAVQAWNPSGGQSGEPDDKIIAQVLSIEPPPHVFFGRLYAQQHTDTGRAAVIRTATKEWETLTGRGEEKRERTEGKSLVDLIIEDGEGWDPQWVARRFCVAEAFVRRTRVRADRDPDLGKATQPARPGPSSGPDEACRLREAGMSTREIARQLAVSQTQVMRWVRQAA